MLDLKKALQQLAILERNCQRRRARVNLGELAELYRAHHQILPRLQEGRQRQNEIASALKVSHGNHSDRQALIAEGRSCKESIASLNAESQRLEQQLQILASQLPNWTHPLTPDGGEDEGRVVRTWNLPPRFDFEPLHHLELCERLDLADFAAGAAVASSKFVYLRNRAVILELALIRLSLDYLIARGFTALLTPDLARAEIVEALGFQPRGRESQIYSLAESELCLVGTAEITLGGMLRDKILPLENLPLKFAGVSHCFRTEAGSHGRDAKGLYRLHQFTKVEMFAVTTPEQSEDFHLKLIQIQEEILQLLELPYRVVEIAAGDLGGPAYRKFDLEVWMPARGDAGDYGEVTSASNCTDFQARRLKIRYRSSSGSSELVHTLNGTAVAVSRILLALLENGQLRDGSVRIPDQLIPYCGFAKL